MKGFAQQFARRLLRNGSSGMNQRPPPTFVNPILSRALSGAHRGMEMIAVESGTDVVEQMRQFANQQRSNLRFISFGRAASSNFQGGIGRDLKSLGGRFQIETVEGFSRNGHLHVSATFTVNDGEASFSATMVELIADGNIYLACFPE